MRMSILSSNWQATGNFDSKDLVTLIALLLKWWARIRYRASLSRCYCSGKLEESNGQIASQPVRFVNSRVNFGKKVRKWYGTGNFLVNLILISMLACSRYSTVKVVLRRCYNANFTSHTWNWHLIRRNELELLNELLNLSNLTVFELFHRKFNR